ncbi:MAG: tetratricopeptide repeat protein [Myxococcota bacterium]
MMRMSVLVLGLSQIAWTAHAQAPAEDDGPTGDGAPEVQSEGNDPVAPPDLLDEEARGLFQAGAAAFDRGDFEAALRYFRQAHELSGRPLLYYNIGHAAERLRRDEEAMIAFERYLEALPNADNRSAVEARLRVLRAAIADAARRDRVQPSEAPLPAEEHETTGGPSPWPFVLLGAGVAVAAGGFAFLAMASSAAGNVEDAPEGTPWQELDADYDRSKTFSVVGGISLAVGGALAVAGAILVALDATADTTVALTPTGAMLRGEF